MSIIQSHVFNTPIGILTLYAHHDALLALRFGFLEEKIELSSPLFVLPSKKTRSGAELILSETEKQLREYFQGTRQEFDLPLGLTGTSFQREVWKKLLEIPFGETISYKTLASGVGRPGASRAVGTANGQNSIPLIIPCHRVISSDGSLGGYSGGLEIKKALLAKEKPLFQEKNKVVFCEQV